MKVVCNCNVCGKDVFPISLDGTLLCPNCAAVLVPKDGSIKELAMAQQKWREKNVHKVDGQRG